MYPFHLSLFVNSLKEAQQFYVGILGLKERRSSPKAIHVDFFGHQLTLSLNEGYDVLSKLENNPEAVPCPHFGAVLPENAWLEVKHKLIDHGVDFVVEPQVRFNGKKWEQGVMFVHDPSGNSIELKYYPGSEDWF
ncbi:VOC family protein [Anthocerotibacter panamensis]|uniref:VOC family protein n=1 Tax=Anthocerotibacter panamensis TaxID=2857077 RepID=UPI001C404C97|nr:VOC family protein [Anthocerotibacter panamensis]